MILTLPVKDGWDFCLWARGYRVGQRLDGVALDDQCLAESANEFAVTPVELILLDLHACAVTAEQSHHGTLAILKDKDIALDDVIEAIVLGEESHALLNDKTVVKDKPVFVHPADPHAVALTGDITVVHDIAWAVGTVCAIFGR